MIYMLEDDDSIRNYVLYALNQSAGMQAKGFEKPSAFWKAVKEELPKVILLDIMLPEEDGLSVLEKLRKNVETKEIPVIMLTAKDTVYDKILGLDSGADDYLAKPFETMELIAKKRGFILSGGRIDYERTGKTVIDEFRSATIGHITLEPVEEY